MEMIDTKALRSKILDLAVRGKLIAQDPNDEPASVLLEHIREEKECLIKDKKIKRNKNESVIFKGDDNLHYEQFADGTVKLIEDEIPFEVPEGWSWERIKNITESLMYGTSKKSQPEGKVPVLRMGNIQEGEIDWTSLVYTNDANEIQKYLLKPNDILFNRTNSRELVGKTSIFRSNENAIFAGYIIRLRFLGNIVPDFINFVMNSSYIFQKNQEVKTDGVSQSNINAEKLGNYFIPIPPKHEQGKIVNLVNTALSINKELEQKQSELKQLRVQLNDKVLSLAVRGKLVPQDPNDEPVSVLLERIREEKERLIAEGKIKRNKNESTIVRRDNSYYEIVGGKERNIDDEIPFEIPESWEVVRLPEILAFDKNSIRRGPFGSALKKTLFIPYSEAAYKVYEQGNAIRKTIDYGQYYISAEYFEELRNFEVKPGDIIISGAGTIGETYVIPENAPKGIINQALLKITLNNDVILTEYFLLVFNSLVEKLKDNAVGTAMKNLASVKFLKSDYFFYLPPLSEQQRIIDALSTYAASISTLTR